MHCHERISKEHSHALVDLVAEGPHGVQVVAGEGQLPMPPHCGSNPAGSGPVGWRLIVTTRSVPAESAVTPGGWWA
jgi:hypothetical protein